MGRKLHSRLVLLKPRIDKRVLEKQERQKADHDKNVRDRFFSKEEKVFAKNHGKGDKWLYCEIVEKSGPLLLKLSWMMDESLVTTWIIFGNGLAANPSCHYKKRLANQQ